MPDTETADLADTPTDDLILELAELIREGEGLEAELRDGEKAYREAKAAWAAISERMDEHERLKAAAHEELRRRMVG